jgi:hypothetical protein
MKRSVIAMYTHRVMKLVFVIGLRVRRIIEFVAVAFFVM